MRARRAALRGNINPLISARDYGVRLSVSSPETPRPLSMTTPARDRERERDVRGAARRRCNWNSLEVAGNHPKSKASEEREGRRVGNWQYEWLDPAGCRVSRAPLGTQPPFLGWRTTTGHPVPPPSPLHLPLPPPIPPVAPSPRPLSSYSSTHLRFPTTTTRGRGGGVEGQQESN